MSLSVEINWVFGLGLGIFYTDGTVCIVLPFCATGITVD